MKRILLGLLFIAPAMVAMEENPNLSEAQKELLKTTLLQSQMDNENKLAISAKLLNNVALSEKDLRLLEAYNLLPEEEEVTAFTFPDLFTRFIDVKTFGMGMTECFLNKTGVNGKPDKTAVLLSAIKALQLNSLEVTIKETDSTLGEFINQEYLNEAIKGLTADHAKKKIDKHTLTLFKINLDRCLKKEAFEKVLTAEECNKLYGNGVNIAYLLSLFEFIEEEFHDLDALNEAIDKLLANKTIENHTILNSINFAVILTGLGYAKEELPDIDGVRSIIAQTITWLTEEDGKVFKEYLTREGDHWRATTKGGKQAEQKRGKEPKKAHGPFSVAQRKHILEDLFGSEMNAEDKKAIIAKLMDGKALSQNELALLEAYGLLPEANDDNNNNN